MGIVGALAQCVLDFLVDERCHACGTRPGGTVPAPSPLLAAPVTVVALARFRLTTRLLCNSCAHAVRRRDHAVVLAPRPGERAIGDSIPVHAAFVTDERLLAVIHLLKFGRQERVAPWLARAMIPSLPSLAVAPGEMERLVVPVPMDAAARRRRGFNQAESMARILAAHWRLPLATSAIAKVRRTRPQSALGRSERLANLHGAFRAHAAVHGARVVLVDDLVTTGATVRACAAALRAAGAREVSVVCAGYRDPAPALTGTFLQS